jgi:protein-S-isoprenylcysteine O-methyltransferase Ste14
MRRLNCYKVKSLIMPSSAAAMAAYYLFFAINHSLLADSRAKQAARRFFGPTADRWYRLAYTILAFISVLPFFYILAFMPDTILYIVPAPWMWLMLVGQALAAAAVLYALVQTGFFYFLGLSQLFSARPEEPGKLVTSGFYCHIRNPLLFFGAVFLWLSPIMTVNLLTFNILTTVYFYLGALHEERALREEFGQEYEEYRRKVPMLLPRIRC